MSRKKWSQPLIWGTIIAILNPLGVSYIALVGVAIGNTLTFVWCALLAWAMYFYAIYLLCTRPHDSRLVHIYLPIMGALMLPWGLVLLITCIMTEIKANNQRSPSPPGETKDG
ncbi:hypothetical protein [Klebsiella quasivariicola]|uniref:hypothetical protein n=1 Tax=Klebsiella quasivariicola TaxID=2026240 RepID=UPI00247A9F7D|nr:hypothetical protein [Klebsiella quasivariicola]